MKFEDVRKLALALPGVDDGTSYGSPALKVKGKLLACIAIHRSAEPDSLAARVAFEDRAALIAADPDTYYLTEHYVDYPVVLARLSRIRLDALKDLLGMSWRFIKAKNQPPMRKSASIKRRG